MTQKIIFLKGLPASGKSTWANEYCRNRDGFFRFNKDDIRKEAGSQPWSKELENKVLDIERSRGILMLEKGYSIIIDDTNFAPKHKIFWSQVAKEVGAEFEEKFFDVPVEECIKRDLTRPNSVGESIIRMMYNSHLKPSFIKTDERYILEQNEDLTRCIIVDIDGTLALINGRSPYDDTKVWSDLPNKQVINLVKATRFGYEFDFMESDGEIAKGKIIVMSGRMSTCREQTEAWLAVNGIGYDELYMRKAGDYRPDEIVKEELFEEHIRNRYHVDFVLDDRTKVVTMWRKLGLLCLQVYWGDF